MNSRERIGIRRRERLALLAIITAAALVGFGLALLCVLVVLVMVAL